jgi:hypothetical protein
MTLVGLLLAGSAAELGAIDVRCDICVRAAFATWATEGLTPHVEHGGRFVCTLAVAGSKLIGMGFE